MIIQKISIMKRSFVTLLNTLYGNSYDPKSPLTNEDGFQKDYLMQRGN